MSKPKRYKVGRIGTTEMIDCVSYEDYARLKAEVERLTSDLQMEKENEDRLVRLHQDARNEVERLIKAGDAIEMTLQADFNGCPYEPTIVREAMIYWRNAKGVQS